MATPKLTRPWRKSTHSGGNGGCTEVAPFQEGNVGVRDSKDTSIPPIYLPPDQWRALLTDVRTGRYDLD